MKAEPTAELRIREWWETIVPQPYMIEGIEMRPRYPYKLLHKDLQQLWTDGVWRDVPRFTDSPTSREVASHPERKRLTRQRQS